MLKFTAEASIQPPRGPVESSGSNRSPSILRSAVPLPNRAKMRTVRIEPIFCPIFVSPILSAVLPICSNTPSSSSGLGPDRPSAARSSSEMTFIAP